MIADPDRDVLSMKDLAGARRRYGLRREGRAGGLVELLRQRAVYPLALAGRGISLARSLFPLRGAPDIEAM